MSLDSRSPKGNRSRPWLEQTRSRPSKILLTRLGKPGWTSASPGAGGAWPILEFDAATEAIVNPIGSSTSGTYPTDAS